jgi:hypothetical protein
MFSRLNARIAGGEQREEHQHLKWQRDPTRALGPGQLAEPQEEGKAIQDPAMDYMSRRKAICQDGAMDTEALCSAWTGAGNKHLEDEPLVFFADHRRSYD